MNKALKPGLVGTFELTVEEKHLARSAGTGIVSVFSTALLVAGLESAALKAVQPLLSAGLTSVGVHLDVSHEAPTPAGMKVFFKATLASVSANGKGLEFEVEASDECGLIGRGKHKRVIINQADFEIGAAAKIKKCSQIKGEPMPGDR